jgi:hypothetical protein
MFVIQLHIYGLELLLCIMTMNSLVITAAHCLDGQQQSLMRIYTSIQTISFSASMTQLSILNDFVAIAGWGTKISGNASSISDTLLQAVIQI